MKNNWLDKAEIPNKYMVSNKELKEERNESYNLFKKEILNMFPNLSEEQIKEIYKEKFINV